MDSDSGHSYPQGRKRFHRLPDDEDADFVNNFRDEGINAVDKYARIVFPVTYLAFNICYWIVFLST